MNFSEAYKLMKDGYKVKLPSWSGYWCWENGTITIYCKDGKVLNLLESEMPEDTFNNIASTEFEIATPHNAPVLCGKYVE